MKYLIITVTTITLIAASFLSGCDRPSNQMDDAETSVAQAERDLEIEKSEVEADLREFRTENAVRVSEFDRKISEIELKIENETDDEVREELEEKLEELEESHSELKREMDNYRVSGRDNWNDFKDSFSSKMDDLGDSIEDFFSTSSNTSPRN